MIKVLFVCLGNICRSPLAEGVFLEKVKAKGLEHNISADSAGTSGWHIGELPDVRSRAVALRHGIELIHRGRALKPADLKEFDYIAVMDKNNLAETLALLPLTNNPNLTDKVFLIGDYHPEGIAEVPDPYYGGPDGFERVYDMLNKSTEKLLESIVNQHNL